MFFTALLAIPYTRPAVLQLCHRLLKRKPVLTGVLTSSKAHTDWIFEKLPALTPRSSLRFPFPRYRGQRSTVLNVINDTVPHPLVNPFVAEEAANNKLLQYLLLRDSAVAEHIPDTSLVGLGYANEEELESIKQHSDTFVVKPLLGSCGKGVQFVTADDIRKYVAQKGFVDDAAVPNPFDLFLGTKSGYLEDLVNNRDFRFENGVSVVQPFIESAHAVDGQQQYGIVRAIVCNGHFVDAYLRASPERRVNFTRGASAHPFAADGFDAFCEHVVSTFEAECARYEGPDHRREIYLTYFKPRARAGYDFMSYIANLAVAVLQRTAHLPKDEQVLGIHEELNAVRQKMKKRR